MEIKVLHILRTYLPITENWLFHLLKNTKEISHEIYCEKWNPDIFEEKSFRYHVLPANYQKKNGTSLISKLFYHSEFLIKKLIGKTKINYLSNLIDQNDYDFIHVHFGTMGLVYESLLMKLKIPFIISFYGYDYNSVYSYKNLFQKATAVFCEGNEGKKQLISMGCSENKISVVPLGIEINTLQQPKIKESKQLKLVQIAAFTEKKGHIYTIKAYEKIVLDNPDISLTLIGPESSGKNDIIRYVRQKGLSDKIQIKNAISPQNLHEELTKYDVFIHPSVSAKNGDHEGGAPVVLLNAQGAGLPVISTRHKDIPDYVLHQKTGFLADEKDVENLSAYILKFYDMENETYSRYSFEATQHVMNHYDITKNAVTLSFLYKNLRNQIK